MNYKNQQGSALMIVIVLMLVFSIIGMAVLFLSENERDTAIYEMNVRGALYAAEMGLRNGERVLFATGPNLGVDLMAITSTESCDAVSPGIPVFPQSRAEYDLAHLGTYLTQGGIPLVNQNVDLASGVQGSGATRARYSLYLRNDPSDENVRDGNPATDARQDDDQLIVNLISVGWVELGGGIRAVKILEEEYTWIGLGQSPSAQKLSDAGGTSSALFG